jgi:isopenicillin-N epimerase
MTERTWTGGSAQRWRWSLEPGCAHLNHGSFGATLNSVREQQDQWRERIEANPTRFVVQHLESELTGVRERLASWLGARTGDLALVHNATTGVNAVLRSFDFAPGDGVVCIDHAYQAVDSTLAWVAERRGLELRRVTLPEAAREDFDAQLLAKLRGALPGARMLVVDHITSSTALVLPVPAIAALAKEHGVPVLVDGAHAPGAVALDLHALGATWYTGNCHKWLCSARGTAFLWASPDAPGRDRLDPAVISLRQARGFPGSFQWQGTADPSPWLALPAALDLQDELGAEAIRAHCDGLRAAAVEVLASAWGSAPLGDEAHLGPMAAFPCPVPIVATPDAVAELGRRLHDRHRIEAMTTLWGGRAWVRISAYLYNELDEYRHLAAALGPGSTIGAGLEPV